MICRIAPLIEKNDLTGVMAVAESALKTSPEDDLALVAMGESRGVKGVLVAVGVKVGQEVDVAGREVDTPAAGLPLKLARRQACKKASSPMKPAPFMKCRLFILLYRVASSQ